MKIVFFFYEGMTALDAIGPHEILSRIPGAQVQRVAKSSGMIGSDSGLKLIAEYSFKDVIFADILVVPGAGSATSFFKCQETLEWIRSIHKGTMWTTSICTGSLILGAAGILHGYQATSHWAALDRLERWGAKPVSKRVVEDGKLMTAAGVSAGIDMALCLTEKIAGTDFAKAMQLGIEYDPEPPFDIKANPEIRSALYKKMNAFFEEN